MKRQKTVKKSVAKADSIERQARIIEAAIRSYANHGVGHAGFSDIAKEAKVPRPLVNYYFPTPGALQEAVIREVLHRMKGAALEGLQEKSKNPVVAFESYIESFFKWGAKNRELVSIWIYFYYLSSFDKKFERINDSIRETGRSRIAAFIYKAIEVNAFAVPRGYTVESISFVIQGLITGNALMAFSESNVTPDKMAKKTCQTALTLLQYK